MIEDEIQKDVKQQHDVLKKKIENLVTGKYYFMIKERKLISETL